MANTDGTHSLDTRCLDVLFARTAGAASGPDTVPDVWVAPPRPAEPAATFSPALPLPGGQRNFPQTPPALETPEGVRAAYEWFRAEKARLDEFTRAQFAAVHTQHQALLAKHMRDQEALALRDQELNREMQYLMAQTAVLQKRARELDEWEKALGGQSARLAEAQAELLSIQQTKEFLHQDVEAQCAALTRLRDEAERLRQSETTARASFADFDAELRERRQEWENKGAELEQRRASMEQRYTDLEKAEAAARRREAELEEWEERLRQELEVQERQQTAERQELRRLRDELDAKADEKMRQRLTELDELEERLRQEAEAARRTGLGINRPRLRA
jgi:chromosome segregation ATPase